MCEQIIKSRTVVWIVLWDNIFLRIIYDSDQYLLEQFEQKNRGNCFCFKSNFLLIVLWEQFIKISSISLKTTNNYLLLTISF